MPVAASMGWISRLSMGATGTAVGSFAEIYDFLPESMQNQLNVLDATGTSGQRGHQVERACDGTYTVGGQISIQPGPYMLGNPANNGSGYASSATSLLTRILGGSPSTNTWSPAETLPSFDVLVDRVAQRHTYGGCVVNRATFRCQAGGILGLTLDLLGKTETLSSTAFPALAKSLDAPYTWQQCVVTLNSTVCVATEFELTIDNHLESRFSNSQTATDISPTDRTVNLRTRVPYTTDYSSALYNQTTGSAAAASLVFTNGTHSLTFTIGSLILPPRSPTVRSRGEIFLELDGICKRTGSTAELTITNL